MRTDFCCGKHWLVFRNGATKMIYNVGLLFNGTGKVWRRRVARWADESGWWQAHSTLGIAEEDLIATCCSCLLR